MSSIHNRIVTTYAASAGNAIAVAGEISGSILGIGRASSQMGNQVGAAERQLRALGTTLRYAIAGTAVFAIPGAVRSLAQLQEQLGLMSAIGQQPGGIPIVGQQLAGLGRDAQAGAVAAITPINDFNSAIVNFLSTVQNVPPDQITPIVTDIAQAARLAQIPVEDATKAFTTMSVAFGRRATRPDIRRTAQEFFIMTREAPGGVAAGAQVVQQLGQLSQVTRLAGGNRPELFGLLLTALRSGIPPAQVGRGLQFLIQTVGLPGQQTKESEQALASVGIRAGKNMPLEERLQRIFQRARQLSIRGDLGRISRMDETTLDEFDAGDGGASAALKGAGITGPGAVFLGQVFHRVHALRTAIALLGQFNVGQYQQDLKTMQQAEQGHVSDINNMANAWERFRREAQLKEAGIALQRLGLQVAQIFEPVVNLAAGGLTRLSGEAGQHRDITRATVFGATGLAALFGLRRMMGGGLGVGNLLRRGVGVAGVAAAGENLLTGQVPKGTASDPLFVIVLAQLGGPRGVVQYPGPIGPSRGPGGRRGIPGLFSLPGVGVAGGLTAAASVAALLATPGASAGIHGRDRSWMQRHYPSLYAAGVDHINPYGGIVYRQGIPQEQRAALSRLHKEHSVGEMNRIVRDRLTRIYTNRFGSAGGMTATEIAVALKGQVTLDIDWNQPDGTVGKKRVHVRMDNWGNGSTPQHRGRNRSNRR